MTPEQYKIIKFAIEQDNLNLVKFILKEDKLSDEQLSECISSTKASSLYLFEYFSYLKEKEENVETETKENPKIFDNFGALINDIVSCENMDSMFLGSRNFSLENVVLKRDIPFWNYTLEKGSKFKNFSFNINEKCILLWNENKFVDLVCIKIKTKYHV